ncbi:hypothetical protein DFH29DRAFT_819613 [Suillus ampliporus]|nr:hypothetical protein DFH29DRAFT_819613 [Suillus ampliporus]
MSKGGLGLLNITARNEAIEITWVKAFMDLSDSRPAWAFITDTVINSLKPDNMKDLPLSNNILTSWAPPTRGIRTNRLLKLIINLIKMAKKHKVSLAPLKLSEQLKNSLPAWLHPGAPPRTYHGTKDKCLQQTHNVKLIKDLREIAERLKNTNTHKNTASCPCYTCVDNRLLGCKNPDKCAKNAKRILDNLNPTFNPNTSPKKDGLTLTHRRLEKNARMRKQQNGEIIFDPSITNKTQLSGSLRIFTNPDRIIQIPAYRLRIPITDHGQNKPQLTMYTDGSCTNNGKQNVSCGGGIWIEDNHQLNKTIKVPGNTHSNQIGELTAVLLALQSADPQTPLKIVTDSKYVIEGLTMHLSKWENEGWIGVMTSIHSMSESITKTTRDSVVEKRIRQG